MLRLTHDVGTVEPGKRADLVVLDADPLLDISALRSVQQVTKAGQRIWQDASWVDKGATR